MQNKKMVECQQKIYKILEEYNVILVPCIYLEDVYIQTKQSFYDNDEEIKFRLLLGSSCYDD